MSKCSPDGKNISFPTLQPPCHHFIARARYSAAEQSQELQFRSLISHKQILISFNIVHLFFFFFKLLAMPYSVSILFPQPGTEPTALNWKPEA